MARDWVEFEEYFGDDVDAEGNLYGLGEDDPAKEAAAREQAATKQYKDTVNAAIDAVSAAFKQFERAGISGKALRAWLQSGLEKPMAAAISLFRTNPLSPGVKAARDDAYKLRYELDNRPELKVDANVPAWLLTQIRDRVLAFVRSAGIAGLKGETLVTSVAVSVAQGAAGAGKAATNAAVGAVFDAIPTWLKIAVPATLVVVGVGVFFALRTAAPYARGYLETKTGMRGFAGIGELRRRGKRHEVCFRARHKGRKGRREVCFPVRKRRQTTAR